MMTSLTVTDLKLISPKSYKHRLALGLSISSWPLLQRLLARDHIDRLALTPLSASHLEDVPGDVLIAPASEAIRAYWKPGGLILVIGAIGAVTRLIAPLLTNKDEDPAVIVLDSQALQVVPLLGGHKAGAESLAIQLAEDLGGKPVITGNASVQGFLGVDCFGEAWGWRRSGPRRSWNQLMISQSKGEAISFAQYSGTQLWRNSFAAKKALDESIEAVSPDLQISKLTIGPKALSGCCWHPPTLWIGIGCERQTSTTVIERALGASLKEAGLARDAIAGLATIDLKSDEEALISIANAEGWPMKFFSAEELSKTAVPNPSNAVANEVGTPSVAEASALLAADNGGELSLSKRIFHAKEGEFGATTIAIAEAREAFAPQKGELHLVGSGPGSLSFLTQDARYALSRSVAWIGYSRYLDLLEPFRRVDQVRIDGQLTKERDRCSQALNLARQGIRVALISSGESGIYGMAGLALEIFLKTPASERPEFSVHPGLSALQLAAARVGAPLMHDFCAISLSDRLTPWTKIEDRLKGAAAGDFVVALYNPRSQSREWQIKRAMEILLEKRELNTPVILARELGRPKELVEVYNLETLPIEEIDMLTLVLVGNSSTSFDDGFVITPRGY